MMKAADNAAPTATIQMQAKWMRLGSRPQPNSHSPRNVDSRKSAASPSIANGAPNTSPMNREYADQSVIRVVRRVPHGLQDRDQKRQPDRHRHEQKV